MDAKALVHIERIYTSPVILAIDLSNRGLMIKMRWILSLAHLSGWCSKEPLV